MRRGIMNLGIYRDTDGFLQGVGLGSNFCSEHEWGIKELRSKLGMKDDKIGIERYMPTKGQLTPFEFKSKTVTWYGLTSEEAQDRWEKKPKDMAKVAEWSLERIDETKDIQGAWCERDFLFIVKDKAVRDAIETEFVMCNLAIFRGGCGPFSNGSLNICIVSKMPKESIDNMAKAHISDKKLQEAVEKTGIKKKLKDAKKEYFALSPEWKDENETEFHFWLNPVEQRENNLGWFTLKDLEDWVKGEGRIPMKKGVE